MTLSFDAPGQSMRDTRFLLGNQLAFQGTLDGKAETLGILGRRSIWSIPPVLLDEEQRGQESFLIARHDEMPALPVSRLAAS